MRSPIVEQKWGDTISTATWAYYLAGFVDRMPERVTQETLSLKRRLHHFGDLQAT